MAIDYDKLLALKFPDVEHTYTARDTILYALGIGLGHDPMDARDLVYVYEDWLKTLPTYPTVLGYPGFWARDLDTGIDWVRLVNGEQGVRIHRPIPTSGTVIGRTRILDVIDKGAGKGALVYSERLITDKASDALLATVTQTTFCRADGGFGGPQRPQPPVHPIPERAPDRVCDLTTRPEQALIYRLTGDPNALHVDPAIARKAGFERPILHGAATFGVAGHAVVKAACDGDASRVVAISGRFSAPVVPGETLRTEIWRDGHVLSYRCRVVGRDAIAINNGRVELAP
ncbi:MAG TPA: MaoC/PaaZ C-terminal domain-containing protein [Xanthobacteraceae bacterium]|nr:MaoC/PaaZ C-terminal domain-containing protein [Xanthobacteraceae bacterium]